jgi:succinate dehydrogenase / fumarate reductase, iron-sulfur subunit
MVVLDVLHRIQAEQAPDLAVRWNCKAGKCGSCSVEINGKPRLSCMTRMNSFGPDETITVQPIKTFPVIKDLVTDVSWNYEQNEAHPVQAAARATPTAAPDVPGGRRPVQEFRKCIECFLCQDVCHVLRDREATSASPVPRFMIRLASLEMHPLDTDDRIPEIKEARVGYVQHHQVLHRGVPRSTSASPTTHHPRSRSAWWTATTTRS